MSGTANDPVTTSVAGKVYFPMCRVMYTDQGGYNNPTAVPTDEILPWPISIEVQKSLWHHSDNFQCEFPLFGNSEFSYTFWGQLDRMIVSVEVAFDEATPQGRTNFIPWTPLIRGLVEVVRADVTKGVVTIRGRSVDVVFGDTRYNDSMLNESVHDTIKKFCDEHGFDADIDDNGETHGRKWGEDKDHSTLGMLSREINQKDMIARLANNYGYVFWITPDAVVHFKKKPLPEQKTWQINCPTPDFFNAAARHKPSNFDKLTFEHNLKLSDTGASITGTLHDPQTKTAVVYKYPEGASEEQKREYLMMGDQQTEEDFQIGIKYHFENLIGIEWLLDAVLADPSWVFFQMIDLVNVQGTNSTFDGPYLLHVITYRLDSKHGWEVHLKCKVGKPDGTDLTGTIGQAGG